MFITLNYVSYLSHISIRGRLLDHRRIIREEALEMIITYLRVDPELSLKEIEDTYGCYVKFQFLKRLYAQQLTSAEHVVINEE